MNTAPAVPPVWYAAQRALRTLVAALVVLIPLVNALAATTLEWLEEQTDFTPAPWTFVAVNGVVVVTAGVMSLVSRWMATPGFNALLTRIGLGSVPKSAVVVMTDRDGLFRDSYVVPDPKVRFTPGKSLRADLNPEE
jgi:hypothetical protein